MSQAPSNPLKAFSQITSELTDISDIKTAFQIFYQMHKDKVADCITDEVSSELNVLTLRQLTELRQQLTELKNQKAELLTMATQNESLFRRYATLNRNLLACSNSTAIKQTLWEGVVNELGLSSCVFLTLDHSTPSAIIKIINGRLAASDFYFGRLTHAESQHLDVAPQGSVAMMAIGHTEKTALVIIHSDDPAHFFPQMDTLFISQLQQLLSWLLARE